MKKIIFVGLLLLSFNLTAQQFADLSKIELKEAADYQKADKELKEASDYILNKPIDKTDADRYLAFAFVLKWMIGTPDYTFLIGSEVTDIDKKEPELLAIYSAACVKYVLENKQMGKDQFAIRYNAFVTTLEYIDNPKFLIKKTKKIEKYLDAKKQGTLEQMLKDKKD